MTNTNNENDPAPNNNAATVYEYSNAGNNEQLSPEEIAAMEHEIDESNRQFREAQRQAAIREFQERRASRALGRLPGRQSWIARAKGRINTKRRAKARANQIKTTWKTARRQYKQNVNNVVNSEFGTNAQLANRGSAAQAMANNNAIEQVMLNQVGKNSMKTAILSALKQSFQNAAAAENARIYANTKNVLLSEPRNHRQTVLKMAALDDLMVNERQKLALASTNAEAEAAATRLYNIEELKQELDQARHETRLPTAEQNARYAAIIAGKNFSNMPTSLYRRLVNNNAAKTAAEVAEAEAAAAAAARAAEEAAALAYLPMVPVEEAPKPAGKLLGGPNAAATPALTPAELRALRAARFGKGGRRTRRHRKN